MLNSFRPDAERLGGAVRVRWGKVLLPDGTTVGLAPLAALTSQRLALQRHHHVPPKLLRQRGAVLDVVQPVHLPLMFYT